MSILTNLTLLTPALPSTVSTVSIDSTVLPYVVAAQLSITSITISFGNTTTVNSNPTVVNGLNYFSGTLQLPDQQETLVQFLGRDVNGIAATPVLNLYLLFYVSGNSNLIGPPSGVSSYKAQSVCRLEWVQPSYDGALGVRVMLSTDPTGVTTPFTQYGDLVVPSTISRVENMVTSTNSVVATSTNTTVTTTTQSTLPVTFCAIDIPSSTVSGVSQFYAMLSVVVQDPVSNAIFESQQIGPITCGYVDLKGVSLTDFLALQGKTDIAGRMISQIYRQYPDLDLSPRSELRDLMIDPVSLELSNMSVREWFSRISQSNSALEQIDDADGDGFSDPYSSSPVKQQLARAYGLGGTDIQSFIDSQFDILGERSGLARMAATASVVTLTFFTYVLPTGAISIPVNTIVSTNADSETPSLTFITTSSATVDASSASGFYDPINDWWAVSVPAQCTTTGSATNVSAGTIRSVSTPLPANWSVINVSGAAYGSDDEINSSYSARIATRYVTGVDSGTRGGYLTQALSTPGIVGAKVVAAGDLEMLRDWDTLRKKHIFGCVDIYTQGTSYSQQSEAIPFSYVNVTNTMNTSTGTVSNTLKWQDKNSTIFQIVRPPGDLGYTYYTPLEFVATATVLGNVYFGVETAQYSGDSIILNGSEQVYQWVGNASSQAKVPVMAPVIQDGVATPQPTTNQQMLTKLRGYTGLSFQLISRYLSPLSRTPALQPVISINAVTGTQTGVLSPALSSLVHTSDFLIYGGSNKAGDRVDVSTSTSALTTTTITASLSAVTPIDSAMDVPVDGSGVPGNVLSVLSLDKSTSYGSGVDYNIVPLGRYHQYGLQPITTSTAITGVQITLDSSGTIGMLTLNTNSRFGVTAPLVISGLPAPLDFLNGKTVIVSTNSGTQITGVCPVIQGASTAPLTVTGTLVGSSIQEGQQLLVSYNKFVVNEKLLFQTDNTQFTSNGALLSTPGFIQDVTIPVSYGRVDLALDGWNNRYTTADWGFTTDSSSNIDGVSNIIGLDTVNSTGLVGGNVPYAMRYIKVTYSVTDNTGKTTTTLLKEGTDFTLSVDPTSGQAGITRNSTSTVYENAPITVSYFTNEVFTFNTQYPAFVEALATTIEQTRHAAADVIIKAKLSSAVDVTMTVVLNSNAAPETMDSQIRTVIGQVMNNAKGTLYQSELVRQVQALTGVQNVELPLIRCAKSDGAYDVGVVVPTQTVWNQIGTDPLFTKYAVASYNNFYISAAQILPDNTVPSGGTTNAFVNILDQGDSYTRTTSIQNFMNSSAPSFYIIGQDDAIDAKTPLDYSYSRRVLLQVPNGVTPSYESFLVTYQVWNEGGASDISISSTEYLAPGRITINYVTGS